MTRPRAAIVVTGAELVRGEREDRNGPFLAAEAVRLGLDPQRILIVGDRPEVGRSSTSSCRSAAGAATRPRIRSKHAARSRGRSS